MSTANGGSSNGGAHGPGDFDGAFGEQPVETTGRYIVTFSDEVHGDPAAAAEALRSVAGAQNVASTRDFESGALDVESVASADAVVFAELGLAVISGDGGLEGVSVLEAAAADPRILAIEPELVMRAIDEGGVSTVDYLRGYRDASANLFEQLSGVVAGAAEALAASSSSYSDNDQFTWGLQATGVSTATGRGHGIKVAVLDTGIDLQHPDLAGRTIVSQSFVPGETVQDVHGHGTHCIGTSCGPVAPGTGRRYGIASEVTIYAGKVLGNNGQGGDGTILAGIDWAVRNGCQVISMSLGADVRWVSTAYETAGRRALDAGTLIVAAAGNNADRRKGKMGFVGVPANSKSIMAVGALDSQLKVGYFSARSNWLARGGQVDIGGPGVDVYSSVPMPKRYDVHSGTSMATPHVAGIAALWAEAGGGAGANLWATLVRAARRLDVPSTDVGAGLAQAPQ